MSGSRLYYVVIDSQCWLCVVDRYQLSVGVLRDWESVTSERFERYERYEH